MAQRVEITGPPGRTLEVEVAGPQDGQPVLLHTGTPCAGRLFAPDVEAGAGRGPGPRPPLRPRCGRAACHEVAHAEGPQVEAVLGDLLSDVDREALSGEYADYLAACSRAAVENGVWGWFDDDIAHFGEWGFDLADTTRPVTIWQGRQD